jgi:hypothetical protein
VIFKIPISICAATGYSFPGTLANAAPIEPTALIPPAIAEDFAALASAILC